jgi:hypothetical protein
MIAVLMGEALFNQPISLIDNALQIFLANLLGISLCRGMASVWPVRGLHQRECDAPSLLR